MGSVYEQVMTALYAIWRRRWYGLAAMWVVCIGGWIAVALIPNQYESNARVYAKWSSILPNQLRIGSEDKFQQLDIVRQTLTSRPNLEKVVRRTELAPTAGNDAALDATIQKMTENITIIGQQDNLFAISYVSNDPDLSDAENAAMAQRVVQNLINIFVEENISSDRENINQAIRFLEDQIAERGRQLEEAEKRRAAYEQKYLASLPGGGNVTSRLMSAQSDLERVSSELAQARSSIAALQGQLAITPASIETPMFAVDGRLDPGTPQGRIAMVEQQLADFYARGYTDKHPDVINAKATIERLRGQARRDGGQPSARAQATQPNPVHANLRSMLAERQAAAAALASRQVQLQQAVGELRTRQLEEPNINAEQMKVNRDYEVLKRQYDELLRSREEIRLRSDVETKTDQVQFQIIDPPSYPRAPVAPNRPLLLTLVLLGGLVVGLGAAFVASQLHTTFITPAKLTTSFDLPVLGSVSEIVTDQQRSQNRVWLYGFAVLGLGLVGIYAMLLIYQLIAQGSVA